MKLKPNIDPFHRKVDLKHVYLLACQVLRLVWMFKILHVSRTVGLSL